MKKAVGILSFFCLCLCSFGLAAATDWANKEKELLSYPNNGKYVVLSGHVDKILESDLTDLQEHRTEKKVFTLTKPFEICGQTIYEIRDPGNRLQLYGKDNKKMLGGVNTIFYTDYRTLSGSGVDSGEWPAEIGSAYSGYYGNDFVIYYRNLLPEVPNIYRISDMQVIFCENGTIKISLFKTKYQQEHRGLVDMVNNYNLTNYFNIYLDGCGESGKIFSAICLDDYLINYKKQKIFTDTNNSIILKNCGNRLHVKFNIPSDINGSMLCYRYKDKETNEIVSDFLPISSGQQDLYFDSVDFSQGLSFYPVLNDVENFECHWLVDGVNYIPADGTNFPNAVENFDGREFTLNIVPKEPIIPNKYKVSISLEGNGQIEGTKTSGVYEEGEKAVFEAIPAEGYKFSYWSGDVPADRANDAYLDLGDVYSNVALTAHFVKTEFSVSLSCYPENAGTVSADKTVKSGGNITVHVTPNADYQVRNWSYNGFELKNDKNNCSIDNVSQDLNIAVYLEPKPLSVNISNYNLAEGNVSVSPDSQTYEKGDIITIKAIANEGYRFARWEGVTEDNYSNPLVVKMESDLNVKPVFEKLDCTLTLKVGANGKVRSDCGDVYGPGVYSLEYSAFDTPSFTAVPNTGYFLNSWSGDVSSGYTNSGTAICNELTTGTNLVNVSFCQREESTKGDWNVGSATGDVIIDPVTGITELRGDGMDSSYEFIPEGAPVLNKHSVEFRVKFPEFYSVSVYCTTDEGEKCVTYTGDSEGYYAEDSDNVVYGLGENTMGSGWFTRTRNILVDLQTALGNTALQLESIDRMVFCGNGFVDYIKFVGDNDFPENWSRYTSVRLGQVRNMEDSSIGKYFELYGPEEDYTYQASKYKPQLSAISGFDVNWKIKYNPGELYRIVFRCIGDDGAVYFVAYTNDSRSFRGEETRFSVKNGDQYWAYKLLPDNEYGNWEEIIANLQETLLEAAPSDLPVSLQLTEIDHLYVRYHNICMTAPTFE